MPIFAVSEAVRKSWNVCNKLYYKIFKIFSFLFNHYFIFIDGLILQFSSLMIVMVLVVSLLSDLIACDYESFVASFKVSYFYIGQHF